MDKLLMQSHDVIGSNTSKIAQLFPHCVTERLGKDGKPELAIDFEKLQAELSDEIIGDSEERYQFTWPDKRNAVRLANTPTTMTRRPCREESVDFDNTQNLYIEGDNLDVLKVLRETYLGKVKMIYIDPPYNTGNDFVYNDDFAQGKEEFEQASGLFDEEGNQTIDPMQRNTESNGRFHTDWLNMIYPRLKVARDLLTEDGAIFISIDDYEIENLTKICNEIFGEDKLAGIVHRRKNRKPHNAGNTMSLSYEFILIYYKNRFFKLAQEFAQMQSDEKGEYAIYPVIKADKKVRTYTIKAGTYCEINEISKGVYKAGRNANLDIEYLDSTEVVGNRTVSDVRLSARYCLTDENGKFSAAMKNDNIFINANGFPKEKRYRTEEDYKVDNHHWDIEKGKNEDGDEEIKELFDITGVNYLFQYPKPVALLSKVLSTISEKEFITLDFFSGSATTAHAVMKLNAEDGGNRKFIMVQLPEVTDEKSEARKAGYKNICEIGKERIRRAGKKIKEEAGLQAQNLDTGFRVLKLDSSNMEDVYYTPQEFELQSLFMENVKADRTSEDLLFQVMLDLGVELSVKIENENLKVKDGRTITVHNVDEGYLMACFDRDIDEATITEIAKRQPVYFVMRDASAASDNVIDNFEQIFKHYSPDTNCRII